MIACVSADHQRCLPKDAHAVRETVLRNLPAQKVSSDTFLETLVLVTRAWEPMFVFQSASEHVYFAVLSASVNDMTIQINKSFHELPLFPVIQNTRIFRTLNRNGAC